MVPGNIVFEDSPLVRFHLERMGSGISDEYKKERNPILGVGSFVSMPYMVGADESAPAQYQIERLFTLATINEHERRVSITLDSSNRSLALGEAIVLHHHGEDIRVSLTAFTSRKILHEREANA